MIGIFIQVQSWARRDSGGKYEKILQIVGQMLEQGHYSPKPIDDYFSRAIFLKFLKRIDPDKAIFLSADSMHLQQQYGNTIDDEILGQKTVEFLPAVYKLYNQRLSEAEKIYKNILTKPFSFNQSDTIVFDSEKRSFPNTPLDLQEQWRKKLKYLVLERYVDLLEQRSKATLKDTLVFKKTDAQLEIEARKRVEKITTRMFVRLHKETEEDQFNAYVDDIATSMDPHSNFFPPIEKRGFDESMSGRFYGIGAGLKEEDGNIKITNIITGTPAWKSGQIHANDIIVKVAQGDSSAVDITGYSLGDAIKLIRGKKGTAVVLTLKKTDGSIKTLKLIRDEIIQDETFARSVIVKEKSLIGYIYLPEFYADFERPNGARCSEDVAKEIKKLKQENVQAIVIDLRRNGGGSLLEVAKMVGYFIPSGPVVLSRDRRGNIDTYNDQDTSVLWSGPLTVMVDEFSASASEIFAAAIQDYNRGIIIGSNTHGKGTIQRPIALNNNDMGNDDLGTIKLTLQKFYRINGGSTQQKGVTPDILLPDYFEYLKLREKDIPDALPWDVIQKSNYSTWNDGNYIKQIAKESQQKINMNPVFSQIQKNTAWLANRNDKIYSLQLSDYQADQKKTHDIVKQLDSLTKTAVKLSVSFPTQDQNKYSKMDKDKSERYNAWLKALSEDIYLSEVVNITNNTLKQGNWGRKK